MNRSPAANQTSIRANRKQVASAFRQVLAAAMLCLSCGSAFGQIQMAIEVTPNNPEPEELVVVRVTVTNSGSSNAVDVQAQVDFPSGLASMSDAFFSDDGDCTTTSFSGFCETGETALWNLGTLPPGAGKTVYMSPTVSSSALDGTLIPFDGRVFEGAIERASAGSQAFVEESRSLELEVDADREPVAPGQTIRYELNFGNQSGVATTDSELRLPLPAGTSLVEASDGGTLVGGEVVWDLATLNPGDSDKRFLKIQLDGSFDNGDLIEVDAAEISGTSNFETQSTRQQATTRVESASALGFSIDMPAQPLRNAVFSPIHVTVTNRSATVQNGVRAELFFPPGLDFMSNDFFSDGGNCTDAVGSFGCYAGETAFWDIGTLPPGAGKTVTLVPFADSDNPDGRLIAFFGRAFADGTPDFWERRTVAIEDGRLLELEVDAERDPVAPGETLRYELNFGNQSGTATTDSELRFPLPAGTSLVEASDGGALVGGEVVWDLATLNPGDSDKRFVTVQLDGTVGNGDLIEVDAAEISGTSNFETQLTRQQATTRVETASALAFSIDMAAQPLRTSVFSPIHVTVTNLSATVQNGVRAELFFPPGLGSMSDDLSSDGGDCTGGVIQADGARCDEAETLFWDIGSLPPGAGKTVTLVPDALSSNPDGRLIAFFGRAFADGTPDFWERRTVAIEDGRLLELEVDAERDPVAPGETLRYELNFGNQSGTATTDSELRFPLPAGTSLVEASDGGALVGGEVVWDLATLNPGDSDKRFVTVQLDGTVGNGDLIEVDAAEISGTSNFETQLTRQQATTRVETASALAFSIDMAAQPLRTSVFSPIHVTVTNLSATVQNGVRAELFFPPGLGSMSDDLSSDGGDCTGGVIQADGARCDEAETLFWDIGSLPPGAGKTVTLVPDALSSNPDGRLIAFFGRAFADGTPDFWERRTVAVEDGRALNLEIDADENPVPGDTTIEYSITVGNQGQSAATMTELTLPLPTGTSVLSADGNTDISADAITWNIGTLESGQATRRSLTLSLDTPLDPGDILELGSGALTADGFPITRNATTVRTRINRDLNQMLSLTPETALPGTTVFADTIVRNDSAVQVSDVTLETAVLGLEESFDIGLMNPGSSVTETLELALATGSSALELGTLLNFTSRLRSSSIDGDFQTRTLIVGEQIPPPPPPDPEIEVSGNGIEIVDGDTTPSVADGTDFGSADFEGETVQRSFVIANTNTGDLEITSVSISGPNQADFRIVSPPASTIAGGEQSTLTIEFDPDNVGPRTATVSIGNNDPDEGPYTFAIVGEGTDPSGELVFKNGFE